MTWKIWQNKNTKSSCSSLEPFDCPPTWVRMFYLLSITLLTLLLPLSFLLLSRLSAAHYFLSLASDPPPKTLLNSLFLYISPNLLHILVGFITLAALIHALTGRVDPGTYLSGPIFRPQLCVCWITLCSLQACVAIGIEGTIKAGVNGSGFGEGRSVLSKLVFFVGLHETMIHWSRMIVRPVVDDTVFGGPREERWPEKWVAAATFGWLSWWLLREEVHAMVGVAVVKRGMMMKVELGDFLGWWLYYLTVVIGILRIMKGIMWVVLASSCSRQVEEDYYGIDLKEGGDKV